jgi:hypothetical protein
VADAFSDYLVFVDESGDHGLDTIDSGYPMFVLAFCVMRKDDYVNALTPALQRFKLKHFGHDNVVLHERDIRKDQGAFAFLKTKAKKQAFLDELTTIIEATPFTLICSVIRKEQLRAKYVEPDNPYHIALGFGLERVFFFLRGKGATAGKTHVMVEQRGKREDAELELEFRRVCAGANYRHEQLPFEIAFVDKKSNSAGLQVADLVARPVGLNILRPDQNNRAFEVLRPKFYAGPGGRLNGWGLKCFP